MRGVGFCPNGLFVRRHAEHNIHPSRPNGYTMYVLQYVKIVRGDLPQVPRLDDSPQSTTSRLVVLSDARTAFCPVNANDCRTRRAGPPPPLPPMSLLLAQMSCAELVAIVKDRFGSSDPWAAVVTALSWGVTGATLEPHMRSAVELRAFFAEQLDCPMPLFAASQLQSVWLLVPPSAPTGGAAAAAAGTACTSASTGASSGVRVAGAGSGAGSGSGSSSSPPSSSAMPIKRPRVGDDVATRDVVPQLPRAAVASAATPNRDELLAKLSKEFTVGRLKKELRTLGLSLAGNQSTLVERLADAQMKNSPSVAAPNAAAVAVLTGGGDQDAVITIALKDEHGCCTHFRLRRGTFMGKVFGAYAQKRGLPRGDFRFSFDDDVALDEDTPDKIGMEDGDIIDARVPQVGSIGAFVRPAPLTSGLAATAAAVDPWAVWSLWNREGGAHQLISSTGTSTSADAGTYTSADAGIVTAGTTGCLRGNDLADPGHHDADTLLRQQLQRSGSFFFERSSLAAAAAAAAAAGGHPGGRFASYPRAHVLDAAARQQLVSFLDERYWGGRDAGYKVRASVQLSVRPCSPKCSRAIPRARAHACMHARWGTESFRVLCANVLARRWPAVGTGVLAMVVAMIMVVLMAMLMMIVLLLLLLLLIMMIMIMILI